MQFALWLFLLTFRMSLWIWQIFSVSTFLKKMSLFKFFGQIKYLLRTFVRATNKRAFLFIYFFFLALQNDRRFRKANKEEKEMAFKLFWVECLEFAPSLSYFYLVKINYKCIEIRLAFSTSFSGSFPFRSESNQGLKQWNKKPAHNRLKYW